MSTWMWRLTDAHAVLYTDERRTLEAVLAYPRFPHRDLTRATTYVDRSGRVVAWQFTFPSAIWSGLLRYLGRSTVTCVDDLASGEPPRGALERRAAGRAAPAPSGSPTGPSPARPRAQQPKTGGAGRGAAGRRPHAGESR